MLQAFAAGVLLGEMCQWCLWMMGHPTRGKLGYWKVGIPHLVINLTVVIAAYAAWHCGVLAAVLGMLGATPIAQLLSISPPVGFLLALFSDVFGDKFAYAATTYVGSKFSKLGQGGIMHRERTRKSPKKGSKKPGPGGYAKPNRMAMA